MKHFATADFWSRFEKLPVRIQQLARNVFELLKKNTGHPSLHLKKVGRYQSIRVGRRYRALGVEVAEGILWFWIGTHADYDRMLKK